MAEAGTVHVPVEAHFTEDSFAELQSIRAWPSALPNWITAAASVGILLHLVFG